MRIVKVLAGVVGGLIVVVIIGLVAVSVFVKPNDFKGRIAAQVKESTGRDLQLDGDVHLSVFPWVALELGPASLGNPPGFGAEPFLKFNRAAVRVDLWPLLSGHLDIQRIDIDGLDVRLLRNAQGRGNWQDADDKSPAKPEGSRGASLTELPGIHFTHGRVSYQGMVVDGIDVETGAIGHGPTPVHIAFAANRGVAGESVTFDAKFNLTAGAQDKELRFESVNFSGLLTRAGEERPAHWELTAPTLEFDIAGQTLGIPSFNASYSSAQVAGKLQATKIMDAPAATGSVTLAPLVLREFAPRLGLQLPKTRDPRALAELAASSDFSFGPTGMKLEQLTVQLDDTHLKGDIAVTGEPRVLKFALTVDQIDLTRYLNPDNGSQTPPLAKPAEAVPPAARSKLPDADGTFNLGAVHFAPLDFSNVRLTLASKDNVVHLFPAQAQIDGGTYAGNISLDARGAVPSLSIDEHLAGVDLTRLLAGTKYKGRLSGRGNVDIKATARGAALPAVMQTLNGHFDANLSEGALEGVDLGYELAAAQALVKREAVPSKSSPARTKFDAFKMSAGITNGLARTTDLIISSPVLRVTGQGNVNLASEALDLKMLASVLKGPGSSAADIPMKITGTYTDPTIRPDVEELAKGEIKQKLQDVLKKNGLQGLFGK